MTHDSNQHTIKYSVLLFVVGLLISGYTSTFGFIGIDDPTHIIKNINFESTSGLLQFWQKPYFGLYIPLTYTIWWITHYFFTIEPAPYHLLNCLFHAINGVLLYRVLCPILRSDRLSFISALLFLVHPAQAASVSWVSEFRGILGATFALSAILSMQQYLELLKPKSLALILLFYTLSTLSKPSFVMLSLLLPLFYFYKKPLKVDKRIMLLFALLLFEAVALSLYTQSLQTTGRQLPPAALILNNFGFYVQHVFIPTTSQFDYGYTLDYMSSWSLNFWLLALIAIALCFFNFTYLKNKTATFLTLGFIITLLPVIGLVPFSFQYYNTVADRYLYFTLVFFAPLVAILLYRVFKQYAHMAAFLVVIIYSVFFLVSSFDFKSDRAFAQSILNKKSDSFIGFAALGESYLKAKEYSLAESNLLSAIAHKPDYWAAHSQLGELFETQKRWQESLDHFNAIVTNKGGKYQIIGAENLGEFYLRIGLAQINLGDKDQGLKNIDLGKSLAPARATELMRRD